MPLQLTIAKGQLANKKTGSCPFEAASETWFFFL
jgi:hypothetical protein